MKGKLAGATLFLATFVGGIFGLRYFEPASDVFISPDGQYKVELRGNRNRPLTPIFENIVVADLFKREHRIARTEVHFADWFDSTFDQTYQRFRWHSVSALGFHGVGNHEPVSGNDGDSLTVSNRTARKIRHLNVQFDINRFLVFDIEPNSGQTLYVNHSMYPTYIYAHGEFQDGTRIEGNGLSFTEKAKAKKDRLFRYCATVEENKVRINSTDLEGINFWPKEITVAKVATCGE